MKKDAGIAAVLNALLPGLGWLYIESLSTGIISILLDAGLFFLICTSSTVFPSVIYLFYWWFQIVSVHDSSRRGEGNKKLPKNQLLSSFLDVLKE